MQVGTVGLCYSLAQPMNLEKGNLVSPAGTLIPVEYPLPVLIVPIYHVSAGY